MNESQLLLLFNHFTLKSSSQLIVKKIFIFIIFLNFYIFIFLKN